MRKLIALGFVVVLTIVLAVVGCPSVGASSAVDSGIDVAPNVLNIQSSGSVVTVHTDIPFSKVDVSSVYLNEVLIESWKADNQGYFVAKFDMDEIKALVDSGDLTVGALNVITLTCLTTDGSEFEGSQEILVINNVPAGGK